MSGSKQTDRLADLADAVLVQMAKAPVPGLVKTRLLPHLNKQQAADLHAALVEHTTITLCSSGLGRVQLWVSGDERAAVFSRCANHCIGHGIEGIFQQVGEDLGQRMAHVFQRTLAGSDAVLMVGSDAPGITVAYLEQALDALRSVDVVLGPAADGGYVLIGLKHYHRELFEGVNWGSDQVLEQTLEKLQRLGCTKKLLGVLPDIDRPADLQHLPASLHWAISS